MMLLHLRVESSYEVHQMHLHPDLRGVVGDPEARDACVLQGQLLLSHLLVDLQDEARVESVKPNGIMDF